MVNDTKDPNILTELFRAKDMDPSITILLLGLTSLLHDALNRGQLDFVILPNGLRLAILPQVMRELDLESRQIIDETTFCTIMTRTDKLLNATFKPTNLF